MKPESARRTARFGSEPGAEHGPDSPPISATTTPICLARPARGVGAALALPYADTEAMQLHLDEISRHVAKGAHAVLLLDRAGWHTTAKLEVPKNIAPSFLPSRAPELNPVENIWQYLRAKWPSNRVFENIDAIIDAACQAWRKLVAKPETITSIGMRDWAHVGQT
jgi:DDE superfamily endonuclease